MFFFYILIGLQGGGGGAHHDSQIATGYWLPDRRNFGISFYYKDVGCSGFLNKWEINETQGIRQKLFPQEILLRDSCWASFLCGQEF